MEPVLNLFLTVLATMLVLGSFVVAHATLRLHRANPAVYDLNRAITGDFASAAHGLVSPAVNSMTTYEVQHCVEAILTPEGKVAQWRRAGSLSDEAVDGVLARQF